MPYVRTRNAGFLGLGAYSDETQCSQVPAGDPYRKPGNYCATPDGGVTTFNADGSTYRAPGAVDPDPAHPASESFVSKIGGVLNNIMGQPATVLPGQMPIATGMSTTTKLMLAGGALLAVAMIARR